MKFRIDQVVHAPERDEMNVLLRDYYTAMVDRLVADGGPQVPIAVGIQDFWDHLNDVMPPHGRLYLARDAEGSLIGCGTLLTVRPGMGEMKRLFVRPAGRGTGLGRALVETRIAAAREMGLSTLIADTLRKNVEMQQLYSLLGFERVDSNPKSSSLELVPELEKFMLFYRLALS